MFGILPSFTIRSSGMKSQHKKDGRVRNVMVGGRDGAKTLCRV